MQTHGLKPNDVYAGLDPKVKQLAILKDQYRQLTNSGNRKEATSVLEQIRALETSA